MSTPSFAVRQVDPHDDEALAVYHRTFKAASEADRADPTTWTLDEASVVLRNPGSATHAEAFVAWDGDIPVGAGDLKLPLKDNTSTLEFDFAVLPEHRRRGAGAALFDYVVARAREAGRTLLQTEVSLGLGADAGATEAFASARGLTLRNTEYRSRLRLPVPEERLDALAARAGEKTGDYRIRSWSGPCPEEYAEEYAQLRGLLLDEAPTGDMEYEPEVWDVQRLRETEARVLAQGRVMITSVAVAPDGTLAGHSQLSVHAPGDGPAEARRSHQSDTLVRTEHRGHRLGLAVKVANLRILQAEHPAASQVDTWNAQQNGSMVAVNKQFGFELVETCRMWQGPVPA